MKMKPIYRAMFATHEALRRLGFAADDIYAGMVPAAPGGKPRPVTELRAQGERFVVDYPLITEDLPSNGVQFAYEYCIAATEYRALTQAEGEANYREHYDLQELTNLGALLLAKGFTVAGKKAP